MFKKQMVLDDVILFRTGKPFNTTAVIKEITDDFDNSDDFPYFEVKEYENYYEFVYEMDKDDYVYGLGEQLGALNKRGKEYKLYSTDDPIHTPEKGSLYGSHPFAFIDGSKKFAFMIDFPGEIVFDIGYTHKDLMTIKVPSKDFDFYLFDIEDKYEVIKKYLELTGSPFVPPKWSWGFQQCRWSYPDADTINNIAESFRKDGIPCDAIYMDIDYMKDYKVFTVDEEKFPNFEDFAKNLKKDGFKLVPIIDPGVKIEDNYSVYEEGKENNYFCKDKDGEDFVAAVWPGLTHFPDFLNKEARKWWGEKYKFFTDKGIYSFWNDMNEPSIFYSLKGFNKLVEIGENLRGNEDMGIKSFLAKEQMFDMANNREDYKSFYHRADDGSTVNHDLVHNLYGYFMAKATVEEGFDNIIPNQRYLLLSRSSYLGHHRIATIWMGDNMSWWDHMLVQMRMLQSLNMAGFFYTGADVGGFGSNASPELVIRWMQLGAFTPLYRNHSALGTREQEPFAFDEETKDIMRDIIRLRYSLIPYSYSEYMKSVSELRPFIKPLHMDYEGKRVKEIEDQYMYGDSIMVAPVHTQNAKGRFVHLPGDDKWLCWVASKYDERKMSIYFPGDFYVDADLNEIPLFIKENKLITISEPMNYVGEKEIEEITVIGLVTDKAEFTYYEDDGETKDYQKGKFAEALITVEKEGNEYKFSVEKDEHENPETGETYELAIKRIKFEIYDEHGNIIENTIEI